MLMPKYDYDLRPQRPPYTPEQREANHRWLFQVVLITGVLLGVLGSLAQLPAALDAATPAKPVASLTTTR